jgi:uncharacterized membrane protein YkvA (DUF1232 family)
VSTTAGKRSASKSARTKRASSAAKAAAAEAGTSPRTGARRTVMDTIKQLPAFLKLLFGLLTDRRVDGVDKMLVAGAIAYVVMPLDLIPDFIPFIGQVDDVFLLVSTLQRLISNAGKRVLLDHWSGDPSELSSMNLHAIITAAAFFLPRRVRRRLRPIGR